MKRTLREIYGAGILFFFYFKWPVLLGYPLLVATMEYQRHWSMDLLWVYCLILVLKDMVFKYILRKKHCSEGECETKSR